MDTVDLTIAAAIFLPILALISWLFFKSYGRNPRFVTVADRRRKRVARMLVAAGLSALAVHFGKGDWLTWGLVIVFFGVEILTWKVGGSRESKKPAIEGKEGHGYRQWKEKETA